MLTPWKAAMWLLLPLLIYAEWRGPRPMSRTWAAMLAGSMIAFLLREYMPDLPAKDRLMAFFLIDAVTAAIIWMQPRGNAQRAIFQLSLVMLCMSLGFWTGRYMLGLPATSTGYEQTMQAVSWLRFVILAGWIGHGCYRLAVPDAGQRDGVRFRDGFAP